MILSFEEQLVIVLFVCLKDAGAKEVHVRISSPPFLHPCYFGTDIPSEDQLIAYGKTLDEIRDSIEADTLAYLGMERLKELNNGLPYCDACFSGNYPIEPPTQDDPWRTGIN